jgi:hypothetical protein
VPLERLKLPAIKSRGRAMLSQISGVDCDEREEKRRAGRQQLYLVAAKPFASPLMGVRYISRYREGHQITNGQSTDMYHAAKMDERPSKCSLIEGGIGACIDCLHVMLPAG